MRIFSRQSSVNWSMLLKIVAWFFIVGGAVSLVFCIFVAFFFDALFVNFADILNIFAGFGLLSYRSGWRKYSIFYLWCMTLSAGIVLCVMPYGYGTFTPAKMNEYKPIIWRSLFLLEFLFIAGLFILHHPKVKALFLGPLIDASLRDG